VSRFDRIVVGAVVVSGVATILAALLSFWFEPERLERVEPEPPIVWVDEFTQHWNANGGEQVNVIMQPMLIEGVEPSERCMDMGGRFYYDAPHRLMVCEGIDF